MMEVGVMLNTAVLILCGRPGGKYAGYLKDFDYAYRCGYHGSDIRYWDKGSRLSEGC